MSGQGASERRTPGGISGVSRWARGGFSPEIGQEAQHPGLEVREEEEEDTEHPLGYLVCPQARGMLA